MTNNQKNELQHRACGNVNIDLNTNNYVLFFNVDVYVFS